MSYHQLTYHVVFSTKDRVRFLPGEKLVRTLQYLGGIARERNGHVIRAGGMADHVHLLVSIPPTVAVADFIGQLKALASGWIHRTYKDLALFSWQDGYAAFTVSPSVLPAVREYIERQKEHHGNADSLSELRNLLKKHDVPFEDAYLK